ncbi:alpha/beta hydrolase [Deinococcus malanensis]|uniref:alpha/beta hydrolase n=1 Tax=Deinococcus malanensis TaxID=1706855 RepID=UPI0036419F23
MLPEIRSGSYGFFRVPFLPEPVIVLHEAEASRQILINFLLVLVRQHDLDPGRVFELGYSQGAIIRASVALSRPDLVVGLVILSSRILPEVRPYFQPPAGGISYRSSWRTAPGISSGAFIMGAPVRPCRLNLACS